MWLVFIAGLGFIVLAHTVPVRFALDAIAADAAIWF